MPVRRRLQHTRQQDPVADRTIREIVETLNELLDRLPQPSVTAQKDISGRDYQVNTVRNNLHSLSIRSKEGVVQSIPGLFTKDERVPEDGDILIAQVDGSFAPRAFTAGTNMTVTESGGTVTIGTTIASGVDFRSKNVSLVANTPQAITFSSAMASTPSVTALSCRDSDGAEVEVTISGISTTGFTAVCPVAATLRYLAVPEV